jgi:hypothetical protein
MEVLTGRCYDCFLSDDPGGGAMERTFTARTELEAILLVQALTMARELGAVSDDAPDGQVLAIAEAAAVRFGRDLTRTALEAIPFNGA